MLTSSFYTGLAGLQTSATALNVVGNNLANINTSGFKRGQANFSQVMSNSVAGISGSGNPIQTGLGTRVSEIATKFEQGSIATTGIKTNLAVQGEGFFQVNIEGNNHYTRSGNFGFDEEGKLITANGGVVQGFVGTNPDGTVILANGLTDIQVDFGQSSQPRATDSVRFISNLNAEALTGDTYNTSIEVYDSKGVAHQLNLLFTKTANTGEWDYQFGFDDGTVSSTAPTQGDGVITFGSNGVLSLLDGNPINVVGAANRTIAITNLNSGAADLQFEWDLIEFDSADPTNNSALVTNFGNKNSTGTLYQSGYGTGVLQDIDFDQNGTMIGFFDNGQTLEMARIALATFNNKQGLKQVDGGFYLPTAASGPASIDGEGTGGRGTIISSSLESSNVDIAEEFTSMIVYQRSYQSNSRTITTADQLLQEALNLKR